MADPAALYSRFVGWVKILLPVAALGLLSTLFLFARDPGDGRLPFSEADLEELARSQGIRRPHYTGVTEDGRAISIEAESASPRRGDREVLDATQVRADLDTGSNGQVRLAALRAVIDNRTGQADLSGGVVIETAQGHRIETEALRITLTGDAMESAGPAVVTGPQLRVDAGRMAVSRPDGAAGPVIVVFKDGVRLIYQPQSG
jgi:lipopolysaccharide export system protein LptC